LVNFIKSHTGKSGGYLVVEEEEEVVVVVVVLVVVGKPFHFRRVGSTKPTTTQHL